MEADLNKSTGRTKPNTITLFKSIYTLAKIIKNKAGVVKCMTNQSF